MASFQLRGDKHSRKFAAHDEDDENSSLVVKQSPVADSKKIEWTDEKHSLYLKSMEASFVNQLYTSFSVFDWSCRKQCASKPRLTRQRNPNICTPNQYEVFRDGCWIKIDRGEDESKPKKAEESGLLMTNPWIQHYRSKCRNQTKTTPTLQKKTLAGTEVNWFPECNFDFLCLDSIGSNSEVVDQNFDDEDPKEKSNRMHSGKRIKTSSTTGSSNDQVVLLDQFSVEDSGDTCACPRK